MIRSDLHMYLHRNISCINIKDIYVRISLVDIRFQFLSSAITRNHQSYFSLVMSAVNLFLLACQMGYRCRRLVSVTRFSCRIRALIVPRIHLFSPGFSQSRREGEGMNGWSGGRSTNGPKE